MRGGENLEVEPTVGIEPTTGGLQNRCSTAELCWPFLRGRETKRHLPFGKWISGLARSSRLGIGAAHA